MDTAREHLIKKEVDLSIVDEIIDILNQCEYSRYAPNSDSGSMQDIFEKALQIISKIEKSLK